MQEMLGGALLLISVWTQGGTAAPSPHVQQLVDRFVALVITESSDPINALPIDLAEPLRRSNPGREAEAERISRSATDCLSRGFAQATPLAARQAALAFNEQELERMIAFVQMRQTTPSGPVSVEWQDARQNYGRWMYSLPLQPAMVEMIQRCTDDLEAAAAAAGLRTN